jgi:hypothetical protein
MLRWQLIGGDQAGAIRKGFSVDGAAGRAAAQLTTLCHSAASVLCPFNI